MNIEIRKPDISAFLEISELDRNSWGENDDAQYVPDGEHAWRLWLEYSLVFSAFENEKIVGVILAFPSIDPSNYLLHKIFLDYNYRSKGIGKLLFSVLCESLDDLNVNCSLTTSPKNNRMLAVCNKFGFSEKQFIKSYYRKNEDRFFLTRKRRKGDRPEWH